MRDMGWWEFINVFVIGSGLWVLLVVGWLVLCFVLGVVVFMSHVVMAEHEYRDWRKSVETSRPTAKKKAVNRKRCSPKLIHDVKV